MADIWTSLSAQTIAELIEVLPGIIRANPASGALTHLYDFLVSDSERPEHEDRPPPAASTILEIRDVQPESAKNQRNLHPRTSPTRSSENTTPITPVLRPRAPRPGVKSQRSKASKQAPSKLAPSRSAQGAKRGLCCREGEKAELFEGPPRKRAHVSDGEEELGEGSSDEEDSWQIDGSPPPPYPAMLNRIAELASLSSSQHLESIRSLLVTIQKQRLADLSPGTPEDLTLSGLIHKCKANSENGHYLSFISMIDSIRLAFHLARFQSQGKGTFVQLDKDMALSKGSISEMYKQGQHLTFIACAGTPYILLLIAVSGMAPSLVYRTKTTHDMISNFCKILRSPKLWTKEDGTIKEVSRIVGLMKDIHTESQPQLQFPIFMKELDGCSNDVVLNFSDFTGCDNLLSALPFKDKNVWRPLLSAQRLSCTNHTTVKIASRQSMKIVSPLSMSKFGSSPVNRENCSHWTSQEQIKAASAISISDPQDIQFKMDEVFAGGIRNNNQYLYITRESVQNQDVEFVDRDGRFLGLLISQTSPIINERLQHLHDYLHVQMPSHMAPKDSSLDSKGLFLTMHFDYFTRFAEQGDGAPADIHPDLLRKTGKSRINFAQRIPYASSTIQSNTEQYFILTEIIQDVCNLVAQAIEKYLPDQYSQLNFLSAPFTGMVLNIQCATIGHRDAEDVPICVVLPFGRFQNGQFVQYETGLVLDVLPGDFSFSHLPKSRTSIFTFLASEGHSSYILMHV
ncbi:hypothetical protein EV702DRAFT_1196503 [Suillus placidus]|uniref:Uncharacterized protein n=1 Tax=Suillus placidus TaxID=48579 RepID=A0A9P6ZWN4_9AGAM|nr:hypothetical protein EV702DRAFT_1196503 [Suillus placidus]